MTQASGMRRDEAAPSQPIAGKTRPGAYSEIGWKYKLAGTLEQAVNILYLLREDPYLHRIDGLSIVPRSDGRTVDLSFRYVTIVLDEALLGMKRKVGGETKTITVSTADEPLPLPQLADSEQRSHYGLIAARNIFRPYLQKPPPPPSHEPRMARDDPPPPPPGPNWSRFKVISLTNWSDGQDISVQNTQTGEIQQHKVGDPLAGGKIVMVDYRELPRRDDPELASPSRVIVRLGEEFFAVELGETLAQKRRLEPAQLPARLSKE
jgi:hypothetical protein